MILTVSHCEINLFINSLKVCIVKNIIFNFVVTPRNFIIANCDNKITWCNYKVKYNNLFIMADAYYALKMILKVSQCEIKLFIKRVVGVKLISL